MIRQLLLMTSLSMFLFTSCIQKEDEDLLNDGTDLREFSSDESLFSNESDMLFNDVSKATEETALGKGVNIPGATVDDSTYIGVKKIVITYNGNSGDGLRFRTGTVTIQLIAGNRWIDSGAVVRVEFNNLRITRLRTNNSITIQGVYFVKNLTGGRAFVAANVQHKLWGSAGIGFANGQAAVWNIARKRTFRNNGGVLSLTAEGDTSINGRDNVIAWGINRRAANFTVVNIAPVVWSSACPDKLMSGQRKYFGLSAEVTVTHGVDNAGNPMSSGCPYGFKIEWKNKANEDKSAVIAY